MIFLHREGSALPFVRRIGWLLAQREAEIAKQAGGTAAAASTAPASLNSFSLLRALHIPPQSDDKQSPPEATLRFSSPADAVPLPHARQVLDSVRFFQAKEQQDRFLPLEFSSVADYLFGLRAVCTGMRDRFASGASVSASSAVAASSAATATPSPALQRRCLLILAAAVSDYHIPSSQMAVHKLESRSGPLQLSMEQTPKVLHALRHSMHAAAAEGDSGGSEESAWFLHGFAVSFKLETDSNVLLRKATAALRSYGVNAVVANMLHTRYKEVKLVTESTGADKSSADDTAVVITIVRATPQSNAADTPLEFDVEVEVPLVSALIAAHDAWIAQA